MGLIITSLDPPPQFHEVLGTSTEPRHPKIDKVRDGVKHFNIKIVYIMKPVLI